MPGRRRRRSARSFYEDAVERADRADLEVAREVEGLDQEIAVLRTRLRSVIQERPEDLRLMYQGMDLLIKAVRARYQISKEEGEEVGRHAEALLRQMEGLVYGGGDSGNDRAE